MSYEIVTMKEKQIIGPLVRTGNTEPDCIEQIAAVWTNLFQGGIAQVPGVTSGAIYGVYTNYDSDVTGQYDFIAGPEVDPIYTVPEEMAAVKLPAGKYAKFSFAGNPSADVGRFWQIVWDTPLDRAYTCDFEEYLPCDNAEQTPINIYIAVK